jgi:hypothetical protein
VTAIRFTAADMEHAADDWSCNCGPAALAAICGLTLDEARPHFGAFPGYTNPTLMRRALTAAGRRFTVQRTDVPFTDPGDEWPRWGLARIQWEGPWTQPGASPRWAYRHTHWVGVSQGKSSRGAGLVDIWDVNTLGDGSPLADGWGPLEWWSRDVVPLLTAGIPRATGGWHVTHAIEVQR